MTVILYLIGKPGTGKFTIASEIAKLGYNICDNQLINNPIFSLLNYDGLTEIPEYAWKVVREIRTSVFKFLSIEQFNSYILTNVLGDIEGDYKIFDQAQEMAFKRKSLFVPVKLLISQEENARRIQNKDRLLRFKSIDVKDAYLDHALININHPNLLVLDVTKLEAEQAAQLILSHIQDLNNDFSV